MYVDKNNFSKIIKVRTTFTLYSICKENDIDVSWSTRMAEHHQQI
jgi:hypothetical protein